MKRLGLVLVIALLAGGCGGGRTTAGSTTTLLRASFTSVADSICEQAPRWHGRPRTPAQSIRYAHYEVTTMRGLASRLARLTPPPGQRVRFDRMLAAMRDIAAAFGQSLTATPGEITSIDAEVDKETRIIDIVAHQLQLYSCVAR